jgi:biopolymer transport protein TolQ
MDNTVSVSIFSGGIWDIIGGTSAFGVIILIVLVIMSFVSWMIIFNKWRQFRMVDAATDSFMKHFKRTHSISEGAGQAKTHGGVPVTRMFAAGFEEMSTLHELKNEGGGLQTTKRKLDDEDFDLIEMSMEKSLTEEMNLLERRVVFLATTGSSAPFIGLLGTIVGIMNSFWSIGERGSASLAIVAPGIAEALLAIVVGLGAAIPAVIAFNWANARLKNIHDAGAGFILEFVARAKKESY